MSDFEFKVGDHVIQKDGDPDDVGIVTHINEHGLIVDIESFEVSIEPEHAILKWRPPPDEDYLTCDWCGALYLESELCTDQSELAVICSKCKKTEDN